MNFKEQRQAAAKHVYKCPVPKDTKQKMSVSTGKVSGQQINDVRLPSTDDYAVLQKVQAERSREQTKA